MKPATTNLESKLVWSKLTIKAVVFDLDGTIVGFNIDFKAARAEIKRLLTKQGLPSSLLSINESIFVMLRKAKERFEEDSRKEEEFMELKEKVIAVVERYEVEAARKTHLIPGVLQVLKTLRDMKLKIALFTANGEKSTNHILRRFRIRQFFDTVITREAVLAVKPDPAHLEATLKALKIMPNEAIVVGDSVRDVECASRLKVIAVGVTTGFSSIKELTRAGADYLASSPTDIPTLVEQINRRIENSRQEDEKRNCAPLTDG